MTREQLLRSPEYWIVQIQNDLYNEINHYKEEKAINDTNLAGELGVTKGYVSQIMKGEFNHKLSKLVELYLHCGKVPMLHAVDLEQYIKDDAENKQHIYEKSFVPVQYTTSFTIDRVATVVSENINRVVLDYDEIQADFFNEKKISRA